MRQKIKGKIYIFEGIDHVGKTTIIQHLIKKLDKSKVKNSAYCFPGQIPRTLGNLVYKIHHDQLKYFKDELDPISLQLLHIAAHIDTINKNIIPDLKENKIVILDRSYLSTYAYGIANGINKNDLERVISTEKSIFDSLPIGKIFVIRRKNIEKDYDECKNKTILNTYKQIVKNSKLAILIDNNENIGEVVEKIYSNMVK